MDHNSSSIWSCASGIGTLLLGRIPTEFGYIWSYDNNLEQLQREVQRLKDTQVGLQHRVDEAKRNRDEIEDLVLNWQNEANSTFDEANKFIEIKEARWCLGKCSNPWTRNWMSKKFEEMTKQISQVIEKGKIDRISYRVATDGTSSPSERGYKSLESRTSVLNQIKKALKNPKMYMIGVHGMGGVGKTTLVNELAWQVRQDKSFSVVAVADINGSPDVKKIQGQIDVKKIQGQIADALDIKLSKETERGRAVELGQIIKQKGNVLIILDDIWSDLDLVEVGIPFDDKQNGCKLVMTSRDLNVLKRMGTQEEFDLRALLEEDSWNLFKKMTGDVVEEVNIKPIAEKVARCCTGLPLLIVVVAKNLRKKDVSIWRDALKRLERLDHEELTKKVYPTLELSYNWLDNEDLKSLFLFIASFELNVIHIEEMLLCCWGLGFYGHVDTLEEARDRHYKLINDLRASSLLLLEDDNKSEWIRMHDTVREVAKAIASRLHPTYVVQRKTKLEEWPSIDFLQTCHYIIVPPSYIGHELLKKLEWPELKLLLLQNIDNYNLEVPSDFFFGMRELRVLILQGMVLHTPFPSTSLNVLVNLRSLSLCRCSLEDMSMVVKLTNLEIFILKDSKIKEPIPTHSFEKLKVIRIEGIRGMKNLLLNSLIRNLPQLHEMEIDSCEEIINIIGMKKQEDEKEVTKAFLPELNYLTLRNLPMLETFYVPLTTNKGNPSIQSLPQALFNQVQFPNLETLNISGMHGLIWPKQLAPNSFGKLRKLNISYCRSLEYIIPIYVAKELRQLQELDICECAIKNIFEESVSCDTTTQVQFPNLEMLNISGMHGLIWPKQLAPNSFGKLRKLNISYCRSLEYVIPIYVAKELRQLQDLTIEGCAIKNIFEESPSCDTTTQVYLEKLTISKCRVLKTIVPSSVIFQSLDELSVSWCYGLVNITSMNTCLPNLRILSTTHCTRLEEIYGSRNDGDRLPGEITFKKLEELELNNLESLTCFCKGSYDFKFPSLKIVQLSKCPKMETFCPGNLTTPNLTKVQVTWEQIEYWRDRDEGGYHDFLTRKTIDYWNGDLNTTIGTILTKESSKYQPIVDYDYY